MIITIAGPAGSGKSTVAKLLARELKFSHYSIGDLRRKMAKERKMTMAEFNKLGEREEFTDKKPDEYQKELGIKEDNFVIDGRTSFYFIPHSVKVYLEADIRERAKRVFQSERKIEKFKNLEETVEALEHRDQSDRKRYLKYYSVDCHNKQYFDLIIDSSKIPPKRVVFRIIKYLRSQTKPLPQNPQEK